MQIRHPIGYTIAASILALGGCAAQPHTYKAITVGMKPIPKSEAPHYPKPALGEGAEGNITLCFTVNPDGSPSNVHVARKRIWTTSGKRPSDASKQALEKTAIDILNDWVFKPRHVDGKPVKTPAVCQVIGFRLFH